MKPNTHTIYPAHRFCVAPMLDLTDKHCRYFHRILTNKALLYTEMVTTGAILYGKGDYLSYNVAEHPVALQLGGSDPSALAQCAKLAEQYGYDQINLNVGCPSNRVQNGRFGACLMKDATLVADCVNAMQEVVSLPVTIKIRTGVDQHDSYAFLSDFVHTVADKGQCQTFIIHARKAWLSGLSPKENREIPPLNYDKVYQLKQDFPHLTIIINGGITTIEQAVQHLHHLDGVMVGREAYQNPSILRQVDHLIFNLPTPVIDHITAIESLFPYIEQQLQQGVHLGHMIKPILGLFQGLRGAKQWRRYLSEQAYKPHAGLEVIEQALHFIGHGQSAY